MEPLTTNDKRFEVDLHQLDRIHERVLKLLELRYQIAIIIIPTIIGLWGFIGLIVSSKLVEQHTSYIFVITELGVLVTIYLIWMWRTRVHDIFREETYLASNQIGLEKRGLCEGKHTPYIDEIKFRLEKKVKLRYPKQYETLKKNKRLFSFFMNFILKLTDSGYQNIDEKSKLAIYVFLAIGIVIPLFFGWTLLGWTLNILYKGEILSRLLIYYAFLIVFSIFHIIKLQNLIDEVTLYDCDIEEYCTEIQNNRELNSSFYKDKCDELAKKIHSNRSLSGNFFYKLGKTFCKEPSDSKNFEDFYQKYTIEKDLCENHEKMDLEDYFSRDDVM